MYEYVFMQEHVFLIKKYSIQVQNLFFNPEVKYKFIFCLL